MSNELILDSLQRTNEGIAFVVRPSARHDDD